MTCSIKIPQMGESISEVVIGAILKESGTAVVQDDEILEIETDKINQVLYAAESGTLTLNVKSGDTVKVGQEIGSISTSGTLPKVSEEKKIESKQELAAIEEVAPIEEVSVTPILPDSRSESRKPISAMRKTIAERLVKAQSETASLTTFNEVDMSEVIKLRQMYKDEFVKAHGVKLGFMSFFVKAAVSALQAHPQVNSMIFGNEIITKNYIDISVAIATERGLVVPVIKDCTALTFADIEKQIEDFAVRAKEERLKMQDLQGGGFTITNGGVFGSMLSTPILNSPQCAILGMHKIMKRAVVVDDVICIRPMMYLALTYDHRLIDGKEAVSFLVHIKNCIEDPHRLELGV